MKLDIRGRFVINIVNWRLLFLENTGKKAFHGLSKYSPVMIWRIRPHLYSLCLILWIRIAFLITSMKPVDKILLASLFYDSTLEYEFLYHKYVGWNFNSGNYLFTTDTI